jgi:MFS family permease
LLNITGFLSRQHRNFKTILIRRTGATLFNYLTESYRDIYIRLMGADYIQLGLLHTIGRLISAIISYPFGRLIDHRSSRNILIFAMILEALVPLTFFLANDWIMVSIAIVLYSVVFFCLSGVETVVVANSVKKEDRARCFSILATFGNIPPLIIPLVAGIFLTKKGGYSIFNINILFITQFLGLALLTFIISRRLEDMPVYEKKKQSVIDEFKVLLDSGPSLRRWLVIDTVSNASFAVFSRYIWIYGIEEKNITPLLIGVMTTVYAIIGIFSSIPLGALADKIGRLKVVILLRIPLHLGMILFLFTNDPRLFILGWALRGTFQANVGILNAYRNELVPVSVRGRWMGMREMLRAIFSIPAPLFGGVLYSQVSPMAPFLFYIFVDVFIRVPLMFTMPKTISKAEFM